MRQLFKNIFVVLAIVLVLLPTTVSASELPKNCQIAVNLTVPESFDMPCYAVVYNIDTETEYMISLLKENDYRGRELVTPGTYLIAQISVVDDLTCRYPFELPMDPVVLEEKTNHTVSSKLLNFDEVEEDIEEFISESISSEEPIEEKTEEEIEVYLPEDDIEEEKEMPFIAKALIVIIGLIIVSFIGFVIYRCYFEE